LSLGELEVKAGWASSLNGKCLCFIFASDYNNTSTSTNTQ